MEIKGKEKCKFKREWTERTPIEKNDPNDPNEPQHYHCKEHKEKYKCKNCFINQEMELLRIEGACMPPGSHCIGFTFQLPENLASSFIYKNEHDPAKPNAKCKYHLKVTFKASGIKKLKTK